MKGIAETIKDIGYKKLVFYYGFLLMLAVYLARLFLDTTSWGLGWSDRTYLIFAVICGAFVAVKAIFYDKWTLWEAIGAILIAAVCILSYMHSHYRYVLDIAILIIGCKGIQFKTVVRIYLYVGGFLLATALMASLAGIISGMISYKDNHVRHYFGSVYPTVFAAHIFYYVLAFRYINKDNFKWFYYILFAGLAAFVYLFCRAETSTICISVFTALILAYDLINRCTSEGIKKITDCLVNIGGVVAIPAMCLFSLFVTLNYQKYDALIKLNDFVGTRLALGFDAVQEYGIKLFGTNFIMNGGDISGTDIVYNFVDNSFMYVLVRYGILVLLMAVICYMITSIMAGKRKENTISMIIMVAAVHCFMEQYIVEFSHAFIIMYIFAEKGEPEDKIVMELDSEKWPYLLNTVLFAAMTASICMTGFLYGIGGITANFITALVVSLGLLLLYAVFLTGKVKKRYIGAIGVILGVMAVVIGIFSALRDIVDMILFSWMVSNLTAFIYFLLLVVFLPFIAYILRESGKFKAAIAESIVVFILCGANLGMMTRASAGDLKWNTDIIISGVEELRSRYPDKEINFYSEEYAYTCTFLLDGEEVIHAGEPDRNISNVVYFVPTDTENRSMLRTGEFVYEEINSRYGFYTNINN